MKKILLALMCCCGLGTSFALTTVNLAEHNFTCNNVKLTNQSTESEISLNCNNVKHYHRLTGIEGRNPARTQGGGAAVTQNIIPAQQLNLEKIKFFTDKNQEMICYFEDNKLEKCKADLKEPHKELNTTKVSSSTAK